MGGGDVGDAAGRGAVEEHEVGVGVAFAVGGPFGAVFVVVSRGSGGGELDGDGGEGRGGGGVGVVGGGEGEEGGGG
jgi:hypothetical protein